MTIPMHTTLALSLARQHQAQVRAQFPRRLALPVIWPRPKTQVGGVTAVPAVPGSTDVEVPRPRAPQEIQADTAA